LKNVRPATELIFETGFVGLAN